MAAKKSGTSKRKTSARGKGKPKAGTNGQSGPTRSARPRPTGVTDPAVDFDKINELTN